MRHLKIYLILIASMGMLYACSKTEIVKPQTEEIRFVVPSNFPDAVYKFDGNILTNNGFALGKKLFYDARLSADKSISCGSCHQQFAGFANLDHKVSHGVNNCLGKRNAPVLFNLAWQREFFWDGGAKNLEIVPINAITDICEMGSDLNTIVTFLNNTAPYPSLFKDAFGSATINSQNLLKALTQFTAAMVSANSKYDKVMRKETVFNPEEQQGYQLFKDKCANCHTEPLFTNLNYINNGLDLNSVDEGRKTITGLVSDKAKFRVPTLRNIELSSPYMHDGRFNTLEKVLEHYNVGVQANENLDVSLSKDSQLGIPLSNIQKQQIISFLKTLTDDEFIKNKIFSEN
ncbi:cytochrome-c peroxidase [Pedobacter frigiditerrae]|uniref:cytochrome-c peroxidase n=1 Tax=Pedobacter frigiditerrae TaxID=2530452 RepID=UPI001CED5DE7|nr:cytochrome c peroxidase [Pedobacter frigiditerrae]